MQAWVIWPEDADSYTAETYPFGLRTFFGKVKLYDFDAVMKWLASAQTNILQAQRAIRVLRFQNPTVFLFNSLVIWTVLLVATSVLSGRATFLLIFYGALLYPGFHRRRIVQKLLYKLWATRRGRFLVDYLVIDENPNLEETNTNNILTFVEMQEQEKRKKVPVVIMTPASDAAQQAEESKPSQ
jgi:hypothetical protein